jgi:osmoprotectant transport system ATP-binding protein
MSEPADAADPLFLLRRVSLRYAGGDAIGPIDLDFPAASTTVMLGTSGAGKSTVLKLLNGLLRPDAGEVLFRGRPLEARARLEMGYVIQGGGLFPHLTAYGNAALAARWLGWSEDRIEPRMRELAVLLRLPFESLARYPGQLSGGQAQRAALLRALMLDPPALLLDEPLGALDPVTRFDLQQDLRDVFRRLEKTVVLVTHDLAEAAFFGGTAVLFHEGRILQRGAIGDLVNAPAAPFVSRFVQAQRGARW